MNEEVQDTEVQDPVDTEEKTEVKPEDSESEDKTQDSEESEESEESDSEEDSEETDQEKRDGFERRVQKLTKQARDAEAEAAYWRRHVTTNPPAPAPAQEDKKPLLSDSNDIEVYTEQLAQWTAARAVKQALAQHEQHQGTQTVLERHSQRVQEFKKEVPDFDDVFTNLEGTPIDSDIVQALLESENGPALTYYLAQNLGEVKRLNSLSPHQRLMALGKLETSLTQKSTPKPSAPAKKISSAPAGLKAPNQTPGGTKDLDKMTPEEFIAYRNKTKGRH